MELVVGIAPFSPYQIIYVVNGSDIVDRKMMSISQLAPMTKALVEQYNVKKISVSGNDNYMEKFISNLKTEYSITCPIEIMEKEN